jgi:four helix bundle protein
LNSESNDNPQRQYNLEERRLEYAAAVIRLGERLPRTRAGTHVAGQLLRCGTSPLPNHAEAQDAESAEDLIHKFKVCLKELREAHRWLRLIRRVPLLEPDSQVDPLLAETEELVRIFKSSVNTAQRNKQQGMSGRRRFKVQSSEFEVQS